MQTFTDINGDDWHLAVTFGDVQDVEKQTGINLPALLDDDMAVFVRLSDDYGKLVEVLAVLLDKQIDAKGLDAEQFARRFGGDVLAAAFNALVQAVIDFFPNATRRETMQQLVARVRTVADKVLETAGPAAIQKLDEQIQATNFATLLGDGRSNGPE